MLNKIFFILILSLVFSACHSSEELKRVSKKNLNDKVLREKLVELNNVSFDHFYSKLKVDYKNNTSDISFKSSLKMTIDSAFSGTISYAGFIMANFVASQDSLKAVYKQDKCYFTENISYISTILGVDLEFDFFEKMLLGKPVGFDEKLKYKQIKDDNFYILSSHKKSAYKKIEKDRIDFNNEKNDGVYIRYYFSLDSLKLKKTIIEVPTDSISIIINYNEKIKVKGLTLPKYSTLIIKLPKDELSVGLTYRKHVVNLPKRHVFSIPESYEECIE